MKIKLIFMLSLLSININHTFCAMKKFSPFQKDLLKAVSKGKSEEIEKLLKENELKNDQNVLNLALQDAFTSFIEEEFGAKQLEQIVKLLIDVGANPDIKNENSQETCKECLERLLNEGRISDGITKKIREHFSNYKNNIENNKIQNQYHEDNNLNNKKLDQENNQPICHKPYKQEYLELQQILLQACLDNNTNKIKKLIDENKTILINNQYIVDNVLGICANEIENEEGLEKITNLLLEFKVQNIICEPEKDISIPDDEYQNQINVPDKIPDEVLTLRNKIKKYFNNLKDALKNDNQLNELNKIEESFNKKETIEDLKDLNEWLKGFHQEQVIETTFNPFDSTWQNDNELNIKLNTVNGTWQENISPETPNFIRTLLRYIPESVNYAPDKNEDCFVFVVVHGTGFTGERGNKNPNYYNKTKDEFCGFLDFAQKYLDRYNKKRLKKGKKPKFLQLFSYEWNGLLLDILSREPAGNQLASWLDIYYPDAEIVLFGHSHGCNGLGFASRALKSLRKKNNINDKSYKKNKPDECRIRCMIFFAAPCKGKIPDNEKSTWLNPLGKWYDEINDFTAIEPINYKKIFIFYSKEDYFSKAGTIDAGTGLTAAITIGGTAYATYMSFTSEDQEVKKCTPLFSALTVYAVAAAVNAIRKKFNSAYYYNDILPDNKNLKGPKVYIETMENKKGIGHSNDALLRHFGDALMHLDDKYPICISASGHFRININTENKQVQCVLKKLNEYAIEGFKNYKTLKYSDNKYYKYETSKQRFKAKGIKEFLMSYNIKYNELNSNEIIQSINNLTSEQLDKIRIDGEIISKNELKRKGLILQKNYIEAELLESQENNLLEEINALKNNSLCSIM